MRILSGIQPSGVLHIGNYFGMMRPAVELQKEGETFYFIADYHALTSVRNLAVKVNETFGQVFKLPEPRINPDTQVVPGLDGQKMSKSYGNNIDIFGDEKETRKRVMSIVTDSTPVEAPKDPERSTIIQLYSLFAAKDELTHIRDRFKKGGTGYGDFKKELFEKLWEYFSPMRKRREEILRDKSYIDNVLARGAKRANEIADQVMERVRAAVGLR